MVIKENQTKNKIKIFKAFAKVCPYNIDLESIKKRESPEPDILCNIDGENIAFEMVDCLPPHIANSICDSCDLAFAFHNRIESLPDGLRHKVKSKFGDINIKVVYQKGISFKKKTEFIETIFSQLWTDQNEKKVVEMKESLSFRRPKEYEPYNTLPKFELVLKPDFKKTVRNIEFNFLRFDSDIKPSFLITEPLWDNDPIAENIISSLKMNYETEFKLELLLYYDEQRDYPFDYWILPELDTLTDYLKMDDNYQNAVFQRIWLFSIAKNKIIYCYPE